MVGGTGASLGGARRIGAAPGAAARRRPVAPEFLARRMAGRRRRRNLPESHFGLTNSIAAASRLVAPRATTSATWSSCGVSWAVARSARGRTSSPLARSSLRACSAHGLASNCSNVVSAARRCSRASSRRRARRRRAPYVSCVRARWNGSSARSWCSSASRKCGSKSSSANRPCRCARRASAHGHSLSSACRANGASRASASMRRPARTYASTRSPYSG